MLNSFKDIVDAAMQKGITKLVVPSPEAPDMHLIAEASGAGLVFPCFVGDGGAIRNMVNQSPLAEGNYELVEENNPRHVLERTLDILLSSAGGIFMQGSLPPQAAIDALHDRDKGMLPKGGLLSFVSVFPLLKKERLILVTDTFINNHPSVAEKQHILSNALKLARILGVESPKVAVLAAIEQVNPGIPSTLDAAILSKMSERRQFGDAVVEGPLDIDCALSRAAAERKGVKSIVTGNADIYLVPEIDTGYLMAEALVFFGRMNMAGVVMGATRPVILNLPFVSPEDRLVQIAMACLLSDEGGSNG
ncbi:MAG: phosphate acyltransferase [Syntrophales bacterium]|nr:phosphate acyltransferase [Syntrophales bacterium]